MRAAELGEEITATPWEWEPRPDVWLLVLCVAAAYWWATTRLRARLVGQPAAPSARERLRFALGLVLLWVAVDWPMDRLGDDFLFSAHMVQFLVLTMIAVPLLMTGVPVWLQAELVAPLSALVSRIRAPVALIGFQAVLVATHLPTVVEAYASSELVHFGLHALWIVAAAVFWLPVLGRPPVYEPLSYPARIAYLIAATIVPTIPASFLTWASTPFYDSYAAAPRVFGISPVDDLQLAGLIMKLGGGAILWAFIVWFFAQWASTESAGPPDMEPVAAAVLRTPSTAQEPGR